MSLVKAISAAEAIDHSRAGNAVMVDARPQVVRHQGSLPGAVVVEPSELPNLLSPTPTGTFPVIRDAEKARKIARDTEIAVVSVSSEAPRIAEQIAGLGYTNVRYVDGGYRALRSTT
ncbi:rhodanese-like domain-containing protein [Gordonia sp. C13]|uniref:rhodanese-like domain-containing protein n=1 Tax=Gordonia sp. C13 TaxID=2935078 RepID=UPI00200B8425|nr:rhodanese-like domain-containing protein [Gordonia sp. C13]MCK8615673.1 rhodanese-like domain-containing protein [Gordonia sp. C13]